MAIMGQPENLGLRMERLVLVGSVIAIFLGLAVMGWHFQQDTNNTAMCTSADAHCDEHRL
jgi:hypothetical protein